MPKRTIRTTVITLLVITAAALSACSGTTNNPSSEVGNPNPAPDIAVEQLKSVSVDGFELSVSSSWSVDRWANQVIFRDGDAVLLTASAVDSPVLRTKLAMCPANQKFTAYEANGLTGCDDSGQVLLATANTFLKKILVLDVADEIDLAQDVDVGVESPVAAEQPASSGEDAVAGNSEPISGDTVLPKANCTPHAPAKKDPMAMDGSMPEMPTLPGDPNCN